MKDAAVDRRLATAVALFTAALIAIAVFSLSGRKRPAPPPVSENEVSEASLILRGRLIDIPGAHSSRSYFLTFSVEEVFRDSTSRVRPGQEIATNPAGGTANLEQVECLVLCTDPRGSVGEFPKVRLAYGGANLYPVTTENLRRVRR